MFCAAWLAEVMRPARSTVIRPDSMDSNTRW